MERSGIVVSFVWPEKWTDKTARKRKKSKWSKGILSVRKSPRFATARAFLGIRFKGVPSMKRKRTNYFAAIRRSPRFTHKSQPPQGVLPLELKYAVMKHLSIKDLTNARLVCKEWHEICGKYIKIKSAILNDVTLPSVFATQHRLHELVVKKLGYESKLKFESIEHIQKLHFQHAIKSRTFKWLLMTCPNVEDICIENVHIFTKEESEIPADNEINVQEKIQKIHFKNPCVHSDTLTWIYKACVNLNEIKLEYINNRNDFKCLLTHTLNFCLNLKKLSISTLRLDGTVKDEWNFDCGTLSETKLEYLIIQTSDNFKIENTHLLPTTLRRFNILMLLKKIHTPGRVNRYYASLITAFPNDEHSMYTSDANELFTIHKIFPNNRILCIIPDQKQEMGSLVYRLHHLYQRNKEQPEFCRRLSKEIVSLINFSVLRDGGNNAQV